MFHREDSGIKVGHVFATLQHRVRVHHGSDVQRLFQRVRFDLVRYEYNNTKLRMEEFLLFLLCRPIPSFPPRYTSYTALVSPASRDWCWSAFRGSCDQQSGMFGSRALCEWTCYTSATQRDAFLPRFVKTCPVCST